VAGSWITFGVPDTSAGAFNTDIMLLLTDGSVLVHNAMVDPGTLNLPNPNSAQWLRLTPDNNGNYETGTWSGELTMQYARQNFASGVMRDGRVFVIGGEYSNDPAAGPAGQNWAWSGEIYDPQAPADDPGLAWSPILSKLAAFQSIRGDCNGSVLADGRVLLGASDDGSVTPSTWPTLTAIWDPSADTWVQAGLNGAPKEDSFEGETFCLLPDGSVLAPAVRDTPGAQRYLPLQDQWVDCEPSPVPLAVTTFQGPQGNTVSEYKTGPTILLPSGAAFAIGGTGLTALYTPPPANDPAGKGTWVQGPSFPADTGAPFPTLTALDAPACLLPSGKVVCMGGHTNPDGYGSQHPTLLEYDPASTATTVPPLDEQLVLPLGSLTWQSFMLLLPTGQILMSARTNVLYLYTPDSATSAPQDAWRPANISVPSDMYIGYGYPLSGIQLNGLSQAVCYGDDGGMATNYPIVQLTSPATGQVAYAHSHDFSTMGVATGATVQSCTIDIPSGLAPGEWNLVVIANGIASEPPVSVNLKTYPCQAILDNPPNPGDYNTRAAYLQALSDWRIELKACEREYGSP
jgi:hypothetical protein